MSKPALLRGTRRAPSPRAPPVLGPRPSPLSGTFCLDSLQEKLSICLFSPQLQCPPVPVGGTCPPPWEGGGQKCAPPPPPPATRSLASWIQDLLWPGPAGFCGLRGICGPRGPKRRCPTARAARFGGVGGTGVAATRPPKCGQSSAEAGGTGQKRRLPIIALAAWGPTHTSCPIPRSSLCVVALPSPPAAKGEESAPSGLPAASLSPWVLGFTPRSREAARLWAALAWEAGPEAGNGSPWVQGGWRRGSQLQF